jgi:hypothetical protein
MSNLPEALGRMERGSPGMDGSTVPASGSSSNVVTWFRIAGIVTALSILVQVILVARGIYDGDRDLIDAHGMLANLTLLGALVLTVLSFIGFRRGALDAIDFGVSLALLVLTVAQIAIGYQIEDNPRSAGSLHWPNGILLTILTTLLIGRSLPRRS